METQIEGDWNLLYSFLSALSRLLYQFAAVIWEGTGKLKLIKEQWICTAM